MFVIIVLLFGIVAAQAQPPDSLWSRVYGHECNDEFYAVKQTTDGGFIAGGYTQNPEFNGDPDGWLVRTDAVGDTLWTRMIGQHGLQHYEYITWVSQCEDGGFVWAGHADEHSPFWFGKVDDDGNTVWEREFRLGYENLCSEVARTPDGGYVLVGTTRLEGESDRPHGWIVRTDADGDSLWSRSYGGDEENVVFDAIAEAGDGTFVIAGTRDTNVLALHIDSTGEGLWLHEYPIGEYSYVRGLVKSASEGYYLVGNPCWILRVSNDGDSLWGGPFVSSAIQFCGAVAATYDGGAAICGSRWGADGTDFVLLRLSASADSLWNRVFWYYYDDVARAISKTSDGGFVLAGSARSHLQCESSYNTMDGRLVVTGPELEAGWPGRTAVRRYELNQNFPNPFNATTTISFDLPRESEVLLNVFDITGRCASTLADGKMAGGAHSIRFDATALPSGVYVYRLQTDQFSESRKLMILK